MPQVDAADAGLRVFLLTDLLGTDGAGGAARASWLLAEVLNEVGCRVTAFAPFGLTSASRALPVTIRVIPALMRHGCRWGWPDWVLIRQVVLADRLHRADLVIVVGMTGLTSALLATPLARRTLVWETTMATPGNPFVDSRSVAQLPRALGLLSPSSEIDRNIRSTYRYRPAPLRLPFWVEDTPAVDPPPPAMADEGSDFLFLGRKDPDKGINELLEAFAVVRAQRPDLRLVICGPGDDQPFIERARMLGVLDAVRFLFLPDAGGTVSLIDQARWIVLPSRHEGYPLVLLDSARRGRPFIATRVGSIPDIFAESEAALLVAPNNHPELVQAMMTSVTEAPAQYAARCEAAKAEFERLSSPDAVRANVRSVLALARRRLGLGQHERPASLRDEQQHSYNMDTSNDGE
jgi:glycosyltransferase involved in cell wall biosynthesis